MALEQCPKMAQKCPHKTLGCDGADGDQCHYVTTTLGTSISGLTQLHAAGLIREHGRELVERAVRVRAEEIAARLAAALREPERRD